MDYTNQIDNAISLVAIAISGILDVMKRHKTKEKHPHHKRISALVATIKECLAEIAVLYKYR